MNLYPMFYRVAAGKLVKISRRVSLVALLLIMQVSAQSTYIWDAASSSWSVEDAWAPAGLPGAADTAIVRLANAICNVDGDYSVARFELGNADIVGNGSLSITKKFDWLDNTGELGGSVATTIAQGATISITATTCWLRGEHLLVNNGIGSLINSSLWMEENTRFVNSSFFDLAENSVINAPIGGQITNSGFGIVRHVTDTEVNIWPDFDNSGIVEVWFGELVLHGGNSPSKADSGQYYVFAGSTLRFADGIRTLAPGSLLEAGAGIVECVPGGGHTIINGQYIAGTTRVSGGELTINVAASLPVVELIAPAGELNGSGAISVTERFTWNSWTLGGSGTLTVEPGASLEIGASNLKLLHDSRRLINKTNSASWTSGDIQASPDAVFENAGTFEITAANTISFAGIINNEGGTIICSGSDATKFSSCNFTNDGTLDIRSGTLEITDSPLGNVYRGEIIVSAGSTLDIAAGDHILEKGSVVRGQGTITTGNNPLIVNSASFFPGESIGYLLIDGDFPMTPDGELNIEIAGTTEVSEYDVLDVFGSAELHGTLNLTFVNGYFPELGDAFTVMIYENVEGQFTAINAPGVVFQADYTVDGLRLTVIDIVEAPFTIEDSGLIQIRNSAATWGDYTDDGRLDLFLTGSTSGFPWNPVAKLYNNAGDTFEDSGINFPDEFNGDVAWADYDNDNRLDLLTTGASFDGSVFTQATRLYRNTGTGFAETDPGFENVDESGIDWGDFDNDGDLDLALTGRRQATFGEVTLIYVNDGGEFYSLLSGLPNVSVSDVEWGDFDNDGDLDLVLTGAPPASSATWIFRNDGGVFTDIEADLIQVSAGMAAWGDYDSDGDLDLCLSGYLHDEATTRAVIYRNDGGNFIDSGVPLTGLTDGNAIWGDYDNDGDYDLLMTGQDIGSNESTLIYRNEGNGFITALHNMHNLGRSTGKWADYDDDGDLDILLSGVNSGGTIITALYSNETETPNLAPSPPSNLSSEPGATEVLLGWEPGSDEETPAPGLTYNLRVGTTPGGSEVMSPMANSLGKRKVVRRGNVDHNISWILKNLETNATYYWSVQTIDNSFEGSLFASEQSFTTTPVGIEPELDVPIEFGLNQNYPNPFNPATNFKFRIADFGPVKIRIYDIQGQLVKSLVDGQMAPGVYTGKWDGTNRSGGPVASGVYLYRLEAGTEFVQTRKMILLR